MCVVRELIFMIRCARSLSICTPRPAANTGKKQRTYLPFIFSRNFDRSARSKFQHVNIEKKTIICAFLFDLIVFIQIEDGACGSSSAASSPSATTGGGKRRGTKNGSWGG
jgi:hypothetical protein